ncbi:MAG: hypothetical protein H7X77_01380 [Anaerolineae bacterium]|nr:hypothetical protein [Anaerolineae bacterium]
MRRLALLLAVCLLLLTLPTAAQDDPPAPQFLYRDENKLVLFNGYTGEATELPFEVTERDRFEWSPDGEYLLAMLQDTEVNYGWCINLYDVDIEAWLYEEPISCAVTETLFSADGTQIAYASHSSDANNESLSLYNLADQKTNELYRTTDGTALNPIGISAIKWSPTATYLTFGTHRQIMGGTLNSLIIMNFNSRDHIRLSAPNPYYASYNPIWSADDRWLLIILKEQYVTGGAIASTNHRGDVYLVNSESGEKYRLTYTPAIAEGNVRWTEDGKIAFEVVVVETQELSFTTEQAMKVEEVPSDQIVWPEDIDPEEFFGDPLRDVMVAPDSNLGAWITQKAGQTWELSIGYIYSPPHTIHFSVPIPENSNQYSGVLIGWRPSDYPYGIG